jgi:signal transduction histidine kinase
MERWWPDRRALTIDVALVLAALLVEAALAAHAAVMGWAPALLAVRIPVIAIVVLLRRRAPLVALAIATLDALPQGGLSGAVVVAAFAVTRHIGRWSVRLPALLLAGLVTFLGLLPHWHAHTAVVYSACVVGWPATIGAYRAARIQLVAALAEVESTQRLLAERAVLQERARIAGEMHDVVGHRVSLLALHAGAVEMAARDPATVARLAGQMQATGRQALQELREMVGLLRTGDPAPRAPQPTLSDLVTLVADARDAGMEVTLEPSGLARPLPPTVERTAYRVIQEALTNAGRHAPGAPVRVAVDYRPTELLVGVENPSAGRSPATVPGPGHGLVGLRERVQSLGGRLAARPRDDGGFRVEAVLPL